MFKALHLLLFLLPGLYIPSVAKEPERALQDTVSLPQRDTTALQGQIDAVTVTAFRTPYNLFNIPAPVNLIPASLLETGSALTPVEALNQVPGILMHHGTLNTNRLTIRGIGSRTPYSTNKIKAYFGEIPLTSGDGETTLEDLENSAISRIEIIKGPSSSLYGAGLGGTLLFHPGSIENDFVNHQTTIASFDTYKNTLKAGIRHKKGDLFTLGSILNSQGFRENNTTNRASFLLRSGLDLSKRIHVGGLLKATKMKGYIPSSLDLPTFLNNPERAAANWKETGGYEDYSNGQAGLSMTATPRGNQKGSLALFGSFRRADELRPFNKLEEASSYWGWRGYYQKTFRGQTANMTVTSGIEFFRERYHWSTWSNETPETVLSDNKEKRSYENLFAQIEWDFYEKLFLSAGINGNLTRFDYSDHYTEDGDESGKRAYQPVISPRLGINYKLSGALSLFANASHGFSTPTFEETLLPAGAINPDIKPESGWNVEAGVRAHPGNRLQATLSYYRIYIKNLLVARRTGQDAYVGVNAGKSLHPGLEAEVNWSALPPGTFPSLMISGNATLANYHFQDFVDAGVDYSGKLLPGTTRNTWLLAATFQPAKNIRIKTVHRHTGKMPVNDANTTFTDPYGITSLEAGYRKNIQKVQIELKAGIQNLFDVHYASMLAVNAPSFGGSLPRYYYPGNPRNFFVSLLVGLQSRRNSH